MAAAANRGKKITEAAPPSHNKPGAAPRHPVATPIISNGTRCL